MVLALSHALLADVVAESVSDVAAATRLAGQQQQQKHKQKLPQQHSAHSMQHGVNAVSPRAAHGSPSKAGLVSRQPPDRLRIEHSPSPPCRSPAKSRSQSPRSPSVSPLPSPSRRRGAAATATDLPSPDTFTPSPRSPRPAGRSPNGAAASGLDSPLAAAAAAPPDTPAGKTEVVSDAATAVMFVHELLQGVDDAQLARLVELNVLQHYLSLAKSRADLPEWQHIYNKLLFDLLNQEIVHMQAEEVRRRRGPSFRLGSDSVYFTASAAPQLVAESVRKDLLVRVAKRCAVGEPAARGLSARESSEHDAVLLENAVEQCVIEMEGGWLWCGEEEDTVVLAVVESLFEELVADTALAFLDPAAQLEVCLCLCLFLCPCLFLCLSVSVSASASESVSVSVRIHTHAHIRTGRHTHVCRHAYIHMCFCYPSSRTSLPS